MSTKPYGSIEQQHADRAITRESQYNFPESEKEYHTAMITGHRWFTNYKPPIDKLITMAITQGVKHFLCGMALGTDQVAAELLVSRGLKWTAVIPCPNQDEFWKPRQRSHYRKLLEQATKQVTLYPEYSQGVMHGRNLWMVKRSELCLAVFSGDPHGVGGGTASTVKLARDRNLLIYQYIPAESKFAIIEPDYEQLSFF